MVEQSRAAAQMTLIRTEDEARAWVLELAEKVEETRRSIDTQILVRDQQRLYTQWMVYHGQALGTLTALHRCGLLSEVGYHSLRKRLVLTEKPTIIQSTGG